MQKGVVVDLLDEENDRGETREARPGRASFFDRCMIENYRLSASIMIVAGMITPKHPTQNGNAQANRVNHRPCS
jgi:hypothetical protein